MSLDELPNLAGTVLANRYVLDRVLAVGGMGTLFEATDRASGRPVAVKVLRSDRHDLARTRRLLREARSLHEVDHPHVVAIYDAGISEDDSPFLVMELLSGQSLAALLAESGPLAVERTLEILLPIIGAVATAHDAGIIHRDLKPSNVFLCRREGGSVFPKLLDFGVAKVVDGSVETRSGLVLGTPLYMSPEQTLGEQHVGPASDVWSMGVMLYECIAGRRPFEADRSIAIAMKIVHEPPPRLSEFRPDVPPAIEAAIHRALSRDASRRYSDMREFARELLSSCLLERVPVPADPDPVGLPSWRAWRDAAVPVSIATLDALSAASESTASVASARLYSRSWVRVMVAAVAVMVVAAVVLAVPRASWPSGSVEEDGAASDSAGAGRESNVYICVENATAADEHVSIIDDMGGRHYTVVSPQRRAFWKKRADRNAPRGLSVMVKGEFFRARYKWSWIPLEDFDEKMGCQFNRWLLTSVAGGLSLRYTSEGTDPLKISVDKWSAPRK